MQFGRLVSPLVLAAAAVSASACSGGGAIPAQSAASPEPAGSAVTTDAPSAMPVSPLPSATAAPVRTAAPATAAPASPTPSPASGLPTSQPANAAVAASAFIDSLGVNIHLSYYGTPYGDDFAGVDSLLQGLGVKHVRDGVVLGQTNVCDEDRTLASQGIRVDFITQPQRTAADLVAWANCVGPAIESYEGPNEYDISHPASDANWPGTLQAYQRSLSAAVRGTPALAGLRVIGPSLTSQGAQQAVGDLSASLDDGNIHAYFGGRYPGTPGYGDGGYGSIAWNRGDAAIVSGTRPQWATEIGFGSKAQAGDAGVVDEATQARYVPRAFLDFFLAGVSRTYLYELVDEGGGTFGDDGLVRGDLSRKPAYAALASLTALLAGGGTLATPGSLDYAVDGSTADLRQVLFERGDGSFAIALWLERQSVDAPAAQTVTLRFDAPVASAAVYAQGASGALQQTIRESSVASLSLGVADALTVVDVRGAPVRAQSSRRGR